MNKGANIHTSLAVLAGTRSREEQDGLALPERLIDWILSIGSDGMIVPRANVMSRTCRLTPFHGILRTIFSEGRDCDMKPALTLVHLYQ